MFFLVTAEGVVRRSTPGPPSAQHPARDRERDHGHRSPMLSTATTTPTTPAPWRCTTAPAARPPGSRRPLRQVRDPNRPLPDVTFRRPADRHGGRGPHRAAYHGPNHSPRQHIHLPPAQRVLMLVDVVFPGWVPFASSPSRRTSRLASKRPPGARLPVLHVHRRPPHPPRHPRRRRHPAGVRRRAEGRGGERHRHFQRRDCLRVRRRQHPWAIFAPTSNGVAARRRNASSRAGIDKLGGADVYTQDDAYQLVESLRIDYGDLGAVRHPSLGVLCCASK